jgi:hypothetical protein
MNIFAFDGIKWRFHLFIITFFENIGMVLKQRYLKWGHIFNLKSSLQIYMAIFKVKNQITPKCQMISNH